MEYKMKILPNECETGVFFTFQWGSGSYIFSDKLYVMLFGGGSIYYTF